MAAACQVVRFDADLTMHVPRDAAGDLECGAESVLAGVDAVERVDSVEVTGLTPRLNDLEIEATVTVAVDVAGAADVAPVDAASDALADGFGVAAVDVARVDHADAGADAPVQEYG
ncbi:MAG: hypothetical protein ABEH83_06125 [Halobacterium sp.]